MKYSITCILCIFLLLVMPDLSYASTSYILIPDKECHCNCDRNLGYKLSYFFEQPGGDGGIAEVDQISHILNIDLSVFKDVEYDYQNDSEIARHWHSIDAVAGIVDGFIRKIESVPGYYKQVQLNPNLQKQLDNEKLLSVKDTAERNRRYEEMISEFYHFHPPDVQYLSDGELLKDLKVLRTTIECFKKSGVEKIRWEWG